MIAVESPLHGSRLLRVVLASGLCLALAACGAGATGRNALLPPYTAHASAVGELTCAGGETMQDLVEGWARGFEKHQPGARVRVLHDMRFSADGFTALLEGRVNCVTFVREPFPSEMAAYQRKFGHAPLLIRVAGGSYATSGGTHAIAIYVNRSNPLRRLTLTQLDAVFSKTLRRGGERVVTTWGELGLGGEWADRPVHVYGMLRQRETGNPPGIVNYMQQRALAGGEFRDDLREQRDRAGESALQAIVNRVAADPMGIGYSGFAFNVPGVKTLALADTQNSAFHCGREDEVADGTYPLSRQIYLMIHRVPGEPLKPLVHEFMAWTLSHEGQQVVADDSMKFAPLTPSQASASRALLD